MALEERSQAALIQLVRELQTALGVALARIAALEQAPATLPRPPTKTAEHASVPPAKAWKRQRRAVPSADQPAAKRGPKPGHRGIRRSRVASTAVDVVLACRPACCGHCGAALPAEGGKVVGRKQVVEAPPLRPLVYEAHRLRVRCRRGQHTTVGPYPAGYGETGRFGPRLVATAA